MNYVDSKEACARESTGDETYQLPVPYLKEEEEFFNKLSNSMWSGYSKQTHKEFNFDNRTSTSLNSGLKYFKVTSGLAEIDGTYYVSHIFQLMPTIHIHCITV